LSFLKQHLFFFVIPQNFLFAKRKKIYAESDLVPFDFRLKPANRRVSKKLKKNRHTGESRHPDRNLFISPFRDYGYNPQHKRKYPAISTTSLVNGEILIILHHR